MKNEVNRALVAKKKFCKFSLTLLAGFLLTFAFPVQGWASTYYSKLTVANGGSGKGYVYLATATTGPSSDTDYKASLAVSNSSSNKSQTYYAWAKAARGYKFNSWTGTGVTASSKSGYYGLAVSASSETSSNPTLFTATANWTELPTYNITFLAPENGSYSVAYSNITDNSGKTGLVAYNKSYVPKDADEQVSSYETDKIELTVNSGTFLGWYEVSGSAENLISANENYVLADGNTTKISADKTIKAKFKEPSLYQARVIDGETIQDYKTFAEALAYANTLTTNPTLQLLDNVLDISTSQSITKSMTLDLNGSSLAGSVSKLLNINNANAIVNIVDNSDLGKGVISMIGEVNGKMYAVYVTKGTLNLQSGSIYAQNTADVTTSTSARAYGVYVTDGYTFNMTGGKIEAYSDQYGYGAQIGAGAATPAVGNFSGGTILVETKTKSRGILGYGQVNLSGNIDIQSTTINTTEAVGVYLDGNYNAQLTMEGGTITTQAQTTTAYGIMMNTASTVNVSGGSITAKISSSGTMSAYGIYNKAAGTVNISGVANILAQAQTTTACGIYNASTGAITFSGGTIKAQPKTTTAYGIWGKGAGTILVNGGTINATAGTNTACGVYAEAGTVTVEDGAIIEATPTTAYALYQKGATFNVNGGKMNGSTAPIYGTVGKVNLKGGFYKTNTDLSKFLTEEYNAYALNYGAEYDAGYQYVVANERPLGQATCKVVETVNKKTQETPFYDLETALLYANNTTNTLTIVMLCDYILPAGNYTLSSNATLLVPWKDGQTAAKGDKVDTYTSSGTPPTLKLYRTLTFAEGVNMIVNGIFEVGGRQHIYANAGCGSPCDGYAQLVMNENSSITLNNGAKLRGWGFITGQGTIDARRGSTCYEMFQIMDFRGGTCTRSMNGNTQKCFPLNQYYIQNIEVPVTYHPGSHLYAGAGTVGVQVDNVMIIGTGTETALFTMNNEDDSEDTWVRKQYDPIHDRQVYDINSAANLNAITLKINVTITTITFNSSSYVLPVTNNMDIHLLTGTLNVTQNISFLPGSSLEIDKEATGVLVSGKNVYFYDAQDWHDKDGVGLAYQPNTTYGVGHNFVRVKFTPSWTTCPRTTIDNAKLNIHGAFKVNGGLYTSTSGSSIISTNEDAGTIVFTANAPSSNTTVYECNNTSPTYYGVTFTPANLLNGDNSKVSTSGTAAGKSYCYQDGQWKCMVHDGCFDIDETSNDPAEWIYYAKPGDYVALKSNTEDATTHLYYSADELRMFILMSDNCQWWEVTPYDDIYYCADNDTYYYYDAGASAWKEKEVTVTWQNWDGTKIADYQVKYNSTPKYLGSLPARAASNYYTYDFIGWSPALTDDLKVTENTVFVAQYEQKDKLYKVTFTVGGTSEINYFKWGEIPYSERFLDNQPGKKLTWTPTISAVTGVASYTGTYNDIPVDPTTLTYTVTWKNYNGTILETDNDVTYNAMPEYNGETPTKQGIADKDFEFDGWTPDIASVTENVVYVAKYRDVAKKFQIRFLAEDGTTVLHSDQVAYNVVPTFIGTLPTKEHADPEHYYYELVWNPLVSAVTKAQDYKATFVEKPNTMRLIVDGGTYGQVNVTVGGETFTNQDRFSKQYDYLTEATIEAVNPATGYHFVRWSDGVTTNPRTVQVTSSTPFTAVWSNKFNLSWNLAGGVASNDYTKGEVAVGTPIVAPNVTKAGYDFVAWTPAVDVTMPEKDVTYTATWTPGNTTYLVEYYKLHIVDDVPFKQRYSYTEYPARTGDVVTPEPIEIEDYDTPEPQTVTVAGGGSTVVKYYYKISETNTLEVEGDTKTITEPTEAYTVILAPGKTMNITSKGSVTAQNLVLQSVPGDNTGANLATTSNLEILGDVCIEIEMNKSGTMDDKLYYCFSVPFKVNVADGVERLHKDNDTWSKAELNTNYRVYTYNENDRATHGRSDNNWASFSGDQFLPGVFYLCEFDNSNYNRYRFYAANKSQLDNKGSITVFKSSDNEDAGWNGVANNGLTDNKLSGDDDDDFTIIQILNSEGNCFETATASKTPLAIGNAAMVQVNATGSVLVGKTSSAVAARRMGEAASTEFINVRLYKENQDKHVDQIFIRASEDAAEQYVAGIDLSKATMGTPKVARMWVNDYDLQLVANEALMTNDQATFSLGMSAPANGEYIIALNEVPNNATIYLTENGSAIWNLNIAPAPLSLSKGTENSYGLRLVHKINNVVTGFDEAVLNGNVQKVILNDHLYIIRDGKVYSAHGHVIK
ncbi:MAG: hypothetical protein KBS70_02975 [Bacteroidales bacterium]|nr:hypothetical protein [Candidatus Colicola equi]